GEVGFTLRHLWTGGIAAVRSPPVRAARAAGHRRQSHASRSRGTLFHGFCVTGRHRTLSGRSCCRSVVGTVVARVAPVYFAQRGAAGVARGIRRGENCTVFGSPSLKKPTPPRNRSVR